MKIATIISSILLVIWVILTMVIMWSDALEYSLYIKISISMAILVVAIIIIALALREYGSDKKLKEHNYLD